MSVTLNPYLSFRDNAREAMEFYQSVFGGELNLSTFGDVPGTGGPDEASKIMHGELRGDNGIVLMGSDTPSSMDVSTNSTAISLFGDDDALLHSYWEKLGAGGAITLPLEEAPWGDTFGMCIDRYGVNWMINISGAWPV